MVKNRTGKPSNSESKKSSGIIDFLNIILRLRKSEEFSDKQMIENLSYGYSHNTVRNIRKMLEARKIIEKSKTIANNEKFYKVIDKEKARQIYKLANNTFVGKRKNEPKITITPTKITSNSSSRKFTIQLIINKKIEKILMYPRSKYTKKICPICDNGKLNEFKHKDSSHDLDKKCNNCETKFYYQSPETRNSKDGIIKGFSSVSVRKYFHKKLVKKSRMEEIVKEAKKIMKN